MLRSCERPSPKGVKRRISKLRELRAPSKVSKLRKLRAPSKVSKLRKLRTLSKVSTLSMQVSYIYIDSDNFLVDRNLIFNFSYDSNS